MIMKQLRAAAAAASVVFAAGAGAQSAGDYVSGTFELWAGNAGHTYALEQMAGGGTVSGYPTYDAEPAAAAATSTYAAAVTAALNFDKGDHQSPFVVLEFREGTDVLAANSRGLITFRLSGGAKFGALVRNSDLVAIAGDDNGDGLGEVAREASGTFTTLRKSEGGAAGDSHVTFEVQTAAAFGTARAAETASTTAPFRNLGDAFALKLPTLRDVPAGGVHVVASTDSVTTDFPVVSKVTRKATGADGKLTDAEVGISARILPAAADAVMLTLGAGTDPEIDLEGRMELRTSPTATTKLVTLGSVKVTLMANVLQSDGKAFDFSSGGAGFLDLSVSGVDATDMVFLDMVTANNRAKMPDTGERLAVSGGMAENHFGLGAALTSARNIYLLVDGKRILTPGTMKVTASLSFRSGIMDRMWSGGTAAVVKPMEQTVEMRYHGTTGPLPRAYAIAPEGSGTGDISNVRVRCDGSSDCQVYLACSDQDGMDVFGKVSQMIPARATMVFRDGGGGDAIDLRDVFAEGDWTEGRLSCDVIAPNRDVEVQVLTRAAGVLVNNTYVSAND